MRNRKVADPEMVKAGSAVANRSIVHALNLKNFPNTENLYFSTNGSTT